MIDAEWLLTNISRIHARQRFLRLMLEHLPKGEAVTPDGMIEERSLSSPVLDGMPYSKGRIGSKTEKVALSLDQLMEDARRDTEVRRKAWTDELALLDLYDALYQCVKEMLSEAERALVVLHFENGYSLAQMSSPVFKPEEAFSEAYSLSTLKRTKKSVFTKAAKILGERRLFPA